MSGAGCAFEKANLKEERSAEKQLLGKSSEKYEMAIRHQGQCRWRAGAPGMEQKLSVAQEKLTEEQADPFSP